MRKLPASLILGVAFSGCTAAIGTGHAGLSAIAGSLLGLAVVVFMDAFVGKETR